MIELDGMTLVHVTGAASPSACDAATTAESNAHSALGSDILREHQQASTRSFPGYLASSLVNAPHRIALTIAAHRTTEARKEACKDQEAAFWRILHGG